MKKKKYISLHLLLRKNNISFDKKKVTNVNIESAADILNSKKNFITFCSNIKYLNLLKNTKASAVIVKDKLANMVPKNIILIPTVSPELEFAKVLNFFFPDSYYSKISYSNLDLTEIKKKYKNIKYGNNLYIEDNVSIGKNVFIGNNVVIKKNCSIGNNVVIGSNVVIENSQIFDDVHICDGAIIGKKGFGFKFVEDNCLRIPHIGKVIIKKGCEIGANCVIDRGSVSNTVIGEYTFIDNLVQIAHNVVLGKKCILASQVGIAGSTKIGNNVIIGGQSGISGHLIIGNNVKIGGKSGVIKNINDNEIVMGYPAKSFRDFVKENNK